MIALSRRDFIAQATLLASTAALANRCPVAAATTQASEKVKSGTDRVTLGRSGIKASLMGIGTGTHGVRRSSNQVRLGAAAFTRMVRHAVDRGITYFDVADQYGSHVFLREALMGVPRDNLFILTKTRALHPEVAKVDIERFRQELDTDTIDCLLMHCMQAKNWPSDMRSVMDVLHEAKEKGRVGAVGVSCHGWDSLATSVNCDWIDVQLARINPFGSAMDGEPEEVVGRLKSMHDQGRGVLGMKICGGGRNASADERLRSLKFVLGLDCVDAFTIGCESPEQIDQNLDLIESILA